MVDNKKVGRKCIYTTEELSSIVQNYLSHHNNGRKIFCSKIAIYAVEDLGYNEIKPYHFTRNKEVSNFISAYNKNIHKLYNMIPSRNELFNFSNINVKDFVEIHYGNKSNLIFALENYKQSFNKTVTELFEKEKELRKMHLSIQSLENENIELLSLNKNYKSDIKGLSKDLKILKSTIKGISESEMFESFKSLDVLSDLLPESEKSIDISSLNTNTGADVNKIISLFPNLFDDVE